MPKLKLRDWQFVIIADALDEKFEKEKVEYYQLYCNYSGKHFNPTDVPAEIDCDIYWKLYGNLKKKIDVLKAKINLFKAEHGYELSSDEEKALNNLEEELSRTKSMYTNIYDKYKRLLSIKNMAELVRRKSTYTDFFKSYDDDPHIEPPEPDPDLEARFWDAVMH